MARLIGVYGSSGFGREVMPLVEATADSGDRLVFIDDSEEAASQLNGFDVMNFGQFVEAEGDKYAAVAIADADVREKLIGKCRAAGIASWDVTAPTVMRGHTVDIGSDAILCSFVTLTANCRIGRGFHANIYSYVAHECVIGDFVTFAPRVNCNGNVEIGDHAYIGTAAVLRQGSPGKPLRIGKGAIVGMGAVVTKDVPDGATVVGNPAREFGKK